MERSIAKSLAFSAALGALVLAAPNQAKADASAFSLLDITDFQLLDTGGTQLDASDFDVISISNTLAATVIGGLGVDVSPGGGGPEITRACAGSACGGIGENVFSQIGAGEFGRADASISGSSISNTGAVPPIPTGSAATAVTVAEARIVGGGPPPGTFTNATGSVNPVITTFSFVPSTDMAIRIDFDARLQMQATVDAGSQPVSNATATSIFTITIVDDTNTTIFSWTPDGAAGGSDTGVAAETDAFDLNVSFTNSTAGTTAFAPGAGGLTQGASPFSVTTGILAHGTTYTATLSHTSLAEARLTQIPEPMTLLLFGAGLLGLGFFARQRQKKTDLAA